MSKDGAARILEAGANLTIGGMSKDSLLELANIARRQGVMLTIKGSLAVDSMVEIAQSGGANLTFDVS